jgi:hypothetical protein
MPFKLVYILKTKKTKKEKNKVQENKRTCGTFRVKIKKMVLKIIKAV